LGKPEFIIDTYPRPRPPLPLAWQKIYTETYKASREGRSLLYRITQKLESWMHRQVLSKRPHGEKLLELGAGTLNHVSYETSVAEYDVVEPFHELFEDKPERERIDGFYDYIAEIPEANRYDRIISIAVLEHVVDLPHAVARAGLLLSSGGTFNAGIPSEGGLLWGLSWKCSVGALTKAKLGLDYGDLMRHEHLSTAPDILAVVRYFFRNCKVTYFPFPSHHLSLYACIKASDPIVERCVAYSAVGIKQNSV